MSKVAHGRVLVSQNGAEWSVIVDSCFSWSVSVFLGRRGQSSLSVVLRGQSVVLIVVVSRRGQSLFRAQSFFLVSRLDRRGQSSWSVVLCGQSAFFLVVVVSHFFVVSQSSQSFWSVVVVSRFSWSVVLLARRGQSFFAVS